MYLLQRKDNSSVASLMVVAVIVALTISPIPARAQTVIPRRWRLFYGGNLSR
jgi:hypothetical protein